MNASDLAHKMLAWEELQRRAAELEKEIAAAVLAMGKTYVVGNVRATYSNPRKEYHYEDAVKQSGKEYDLTEYEKTSYDWRKLAKDLELEVDFIEKSPASVSLKLK